jgi:hypothetical protein
MPLPLTIGRTLDHCRRRKLEVVGNCDRGCGIHQPIDFAEFPAPMGSYTIDELQRRRCLTCDCGRPFGAVLVFGTHWGMRSSVETWNRRGWVRPTDSDGTSA